MSPEPLTISLHEFLRSRRSVRRFTDAPVDAEALERILESATYAPNAHNRQPWRFAVVSTPAAKSRLAEHMAADFRRALEADGVMDEEIEAQIARSMARTEETPVVVVLCADFTVMDAYDDPVRNQGEHTMAMQSVALAGGQLLLAAHAEGLGGVWVCAPLFAPAQVRAALDLPETWEPQGMLLLGHPAGESKSRERRPVSDVTVYK
ncbi:MAG: nitroreductase family protein [Anaerolineae bacterium]|nr:MAG: nitroreductase family protein [Anaerolineae bacterium]